MFRLVVVEDTVRIPPDKFGTPLKEAALEQIKMKYENIVDDKLGYVILVIDVDVDQLGRILPGDGSTYHRATFKLLTFYPEVQEVVEGELVEVTDFGAFVRIGPEDALLHISQIMDDYITYDERHGLLLGKETQRRLSKGDLIRGRIIAVSFPKGRSGGKIAVTMRQPFLGKLEWIAEEVKKLRAKAGEKEA